MMKNIRLITGLKLAVLTCFLLFVFCAVGLNAANPKKVPVGTITLIKGNVLIKHIATDKYSLAKTGEIVFFGDSLKTDTGAGVIVVYKDGSRSSVGEEAEFSIPAPEKGKPAPKILTAIALAIGDLWMKVTKRTEPLEVQSANGVAAIKGTTFMMSVDKNGDAILTVFEGLVEFKNKLGSALVDASKQSRSGQNQPPSTPVIVNLGKIPVPNPTPTPVPTAVPTKKLQVNVKDASGQSKTLILDYQK